MSSLHTVNAAESRLLARTVRLRTAAFGLQDAGEVAVDFSRELSRAWKEGGLAAMSSVCFSLAAAVENVPGSWNVYSEAKALAAALA